MKFRVGHEWRVGAMFLPARPGLTPGVLMLHGFPGALRNEDLAAELCRRGVTVLLPHFRGCWGSAGEYSIPGLLTDALAADRLLRRYRHVDRTRVGVLGYSLGGWVALELAARRRFAAVAALAPAWPRDDAPGDAEYLRRSARVLNAPHVERIWADYMAAARNERPEDRLPLIAPTPLLFVQGLMDRMVPAASTARLHAVAPQPKKLLEFPGEDHEFETDRAAVVAAVAGWLAGVLRAAPAARRFHAAHGSHGA